ncbi:UDP-N-acetylmuramoyl-tripeptide--D-alanyl-D-alanine ligase [Salidesulfovibrio onnuriiensis]|uniref:UDP-N-acetylmuramoyl-tripeptide--D-alanyl-D- alanine ligase n=1 Tax=Salidesulfovibrio onnuriiensis TaxID=2583823 RepID=UPI00202B3A5D|nr:UDP-N-acetylmuramoyl-tripeptide--D-alanyl-D-alanine ligase [Salidesulfovibrio onnuriiensis]
MTLADIQRCLTGMADSGMEGIQVHAVRTDSRAVTSGDLYICIEGERFDGHEFAAQAAKAGACGIVSSKILDPSIEEAGVPVFMVRDTTVALGQLAACYRSLCGAKLIAITGTAGKTTVKELLAEVCSARFDVAKNYRNFNNQIGLPVSMLQAGEKQDLWIMECGISLASDMAELGPIACPDVAVITNIGPGHLQGLGDIEGVAKAKASLLRYLQPGGVAVVSMDYPQLWKAATEICPEPVGFSTMNEKASFFCLFLGPSQFGSGRFLLRTPKGEVEFEAPFCGEHFAENLAAVAAAAHTVGLGPQHVVDGASRFCADNQRFCQRPVGNITLIDDTYNANPLSMKRSIETAKCIAGERPLILLLADMLELGSEAAKRHRELGEVLALVKPDAVYWKGEHMDDVRAAYPDVVELKAPEAFARDWKGMNIHDAVVLLKGSRSMKMEKYTQALKETLEGAAS